ncbi:hypothetical protein CPAR01_13585 [Colletotrichum paranaense]|uniref:Uncharacterized protein n=1 Tax=Colletotrichum paranaense TaxID=1914294 RepID=A0ABQ9S3T1_9PEZI|nr:uncharacterized protein CPAR01_13585 [Colletotrichum paranaense]KAK1524637.1 hypothetical protein CPAR01_13585 [Colletotrichum paranaense]
MTDVSSQRSSCSLPSTSRSTYIRYDFPFSCWSPLFFFFLQNTLFCVCLQEGDPFRPVSLHASKPLDVKTRRGSSPPTAHHQSPSLLSSYPAHHHTCSTVVRIGASSGAIPRARQGSMAA